MAPSTRSLASCVAAGTLLIVSCATRDATAPSPPGAPASLRIATGNNQSAPAGTTIGQRIVFQVIDKLGNGVPGVPVLFQIVSGEGMLNAGTSSVATDSRGFATSPTWTLGKLAYPQQLSATVGAMSDTAIAVVSTQFHAELRFFGAPIDAAYAPAFTRATARLNAEVVGQLSAVTFTNQDVAGTCGATGVAPLNEKIPNLLVFVRVGPIDGAGGVVASSGPCYVRESNGLTVVGTAQFDAADLPQALKNGQLDDVVFHELQHVLGFGTLWSTATPPLVINPGTVHTAFVGAAGVRGCLQVGGPVIDCSPSVPLESGGGVGAADTHWRASIFGNELMTAFLLPAGVSRPLSAMTLGSIADLGYQVNANVADAYQISSSVADAVTRIHAAQDRDVSVARDVVVEPRLAVNATGGATSPIRRAP